MKFEINYSKNEEKIPEDFMREEYDFDYSKGVRGKYSRIVTEINGYIKLSDDVYKFFKTSEEVNNALRSIIKAIPNFDNSNYQKA